MRYRAETKIGGKKIKKNKKGRITKTKDPPLGGVPNYDIRPGLFLSFVCNSEDVKILLVMF